MIDLTKFGLAPKDTAATLVHPMCADQFTAWQDRASPAQKGWVTASGFAAKPGNAICFVGADGAIDFAIGIVGGHAIWDAAKIATTLPNSIWQLGHDGSSLSADTIENFTLGWGLSQYRFDHYRPTKAETPNQLVMPKTINQDRLLGLLAGIYLCRDLINQPPNHMNPVALEKAVTSVAKAHGARIETHCGTALETDFPAIHTVGRAAETAPLLVDLRWGTKGPKITLIGKGITFDSGGLDLKPSKAMEMMKKDMGGAATVIGLADAIMTAKLPIQLRVLVAAAENAVSDRSMRPLDIINTRAGTKVEIGNTDAEGRLVLADAITYALEDAPDFLVDFATLTGAARVALGTELPALFCNTDDTAAAILRASETVHDPLWRLPLFDDYDRHLDAGYAALSSTGLSGYGGAITAALFLRRFAGKASNWAHIDVMAWNIASRPGRPKGGEAMGLRALFGFIAGLARSSRDS